MYPTSGGMYIPPSPLVAQRSARASFGTAAAAGEDPMISNLRRENETLKRKLAELSLKMSEKDREIETLKGKKELASASGTQQREEFNTIPNPKNNL